MTTGIAKRCQCGDPLLEGDSGALRCLHCDRGQCNTAHREAFPAGPDCDTNHDPKICPRCIQLDAWLPNYEKE